ncbi:MAG TPA: hypothetical protein VLU94_01820 [Candidatus Nitrosotalea sp.]|nr:hypothetical protein [Candidatus Nitrosotalea sp.]
MKNELQDPSERIRLIERSLRCFVYGWFSLIPLLGLGMAVTALGLHFKTWADTGDSWNPARRYLFAGFILAWIGVLISIGGLALFVLVLIKHYEY